MSDNNSSSGGIGFGGALALLFIGLKLGGVIDWSWWWVLSPLWIGLLIVVAILSVWLCVIGVSSFFDWRRDRSRLKGMYR